MTVTGVERPSTTATWLSPSLTAAAISTDANYNGLNPPDVTVTNTDNDTAGITVTPISGLTTTEAGGTATFTIVLDSQPTANVTIGLTSSDTTEGTVIARQRDVHAGQLEHAQTVTVTGVNDAVDDGDIALHDRHRGGRQHAIRTTAA